MLVDKLKNQRIKFDLKIILTINYQRYINVNGLISPMAICFLIAVSCPPPCQIEINEYNLFGHRRISR